MDVVNAMDREEHHRVAGPGDVRLPARHTQQQFERAYHIAQQRGVDVFIENEPPKPPERPSRGDVFVSSTCSQVEFERAHAAACRRGGQVRFW